MASSRSRVIGRMFVPIGDEGSGYYSDTSLNTFGVVMATQSLVLKAIMESPPPNGPFVICEYGAADGGTSITLIGNCIKTIREKFGEDKEILVYYEDLPSNDFQSLLKRVHGELSGSTTYLSNNPGIYVSCIGTSFYSKCLPAKSVHLGLSFTAMHWLSSVPCTLRNTIHDVLTDDVDEKEAFSMQAARDWNTILLARSHELAIGCYMVLACICVDEEGQYAGCRRNSKNNVFERLSSLWAQMVTKGYITQEEFTSTVIEVHQRSVMELSALFTDMSSEVYRSGLRLLSIETKVVPCYFHKKWMTEGKKGDAEAARVHAKSYVAGIRVWSDASFRAGLNGARTEQEKDAILKEFYKSYEEEVAAAPEDHTWDFVHAYLAIQKVQ